MPTLFRFLFVTGTIAAAFYAGMYVLATRFEPESRNTVYRLEDLRASGPLATPEPVTDPETVETVSQPQTEDATAPPQSTPEAE